MRVWGEKWAICFDGEDGSAMAPPVSRAPEPTIRS